jgi:oligopeptide transport system substrate-binding protein
MSYRVVFFAVMLAAGLSAVAWAVLRVQLPPADFTFVNESEVKSLDPHNVTGQPEHRILEAVFEGLTRLHPKTCLPQAGAAYWPPEISDDKRTYTFHLRQGARWSNGEPVTAHDFVFSYRRFLDPLTKAEYAYQAWYIKNAKRYSSGSGGFGPGDRVEVELNERPEGALAHARGKVVYGTLLSTEGEGRDRTFVVNCDGGERRFRIGEATRARDGAEPCKQVLLDFREVGVRAIDDYTLETVLDHPTPFWLGLTAYHAVLPVNRTCIETFGTPQWTYPENVVTNGAYRVGFRRIRDRIRLVKNESYWDKANVRLEVIDALAITSQVTAFNLFDTGKADWITDPPAIVLRELLAPGRPRVELNPKPFLSTYYYMLNIKRKPLDDVRVRRALAMALDRKEVTRTALAAGEVPAYSLVPPGMPDYDGPTFGQENVAEAQRLLAEAGFPDGRGFPRLDILYNTHEAHRTIAELVRKQWERNLGITVSTRNEEWGTYQNSIRLFEYAVARRGWIGDYLDPNTYLDLMVTDGENNSTGWSNAEYDRLIAAAEVETDEDARRDILRRAERLLMDELPIIPIYFYVGKNMVKPYVRGFYGNLLDNHPLYRIWIDRESSGPNEYMSE